MDATRAELSVRRTKALIAAGDSAEIVSTRRARGVGRGIKERSHVPIGVTRQ
jgi:hypothetical protein